MTILYEYGVAKLQKEVLLGGEVEWQDGVGEDLGIIGGQESFPDGVRSGG